MVSDGVKVVVPPSVVDRAQFSATLHIEFGNMFGQLTRPDSLRDRLSEDALAISLEHHGAIVTLILQGFVASAHALIRPMIEATLRGAWIKNLANDDQLKLEANGHSTRKLEYFIRELKSRHPATRGIAKSAEAVSATINSFTHGGFHLVSRRETGFDPTEVERMLMFADLFALFASSTVALIHGMTEAGARIESWAERIDTEVKSNIAAAPDR